MFSCAGAGSDASWVAMCSPVHACVLAPELQGPHAGFFLGLLDQCLIELVQRERVDLRTQQQVVLSPVAATRCAAFGLQEPVEAEQPVQILRAADDGEAPAAQATEEVRAVRSIAWRAVPSYRVHAVAHRR